MKNRIPIVQNNRGLTLVEVTVTAMILGMVLAVVCGVFFSSNQLHRKTNERVEIQNDTRLGLSIMTKELRHAGCDPMEFGVTGVVQAAADTVRVRADLDGDGTIQTTEPSEDVLYFYDPATETVFRNPGTGAQAIVSNVTAMTISYLDGANNVLGPLPLDNTLITQVRSISITITTDSQDAGQVTWGTTIALRNLSG